MGTLRYIVKRIAISIVLLFITSFLVYAGIRSTVDPTARLAQNRNPQARIDLKEKLHLDEPLVTQYKRWVGNAIKGDLGVSDTDQEAVTAKLKRSLLITTELLLWGVIIAGLLGITLGVIAAIKRNTPIDYGIQTYSSMGIAQPPFLFAFVLMAFFAILIPRWIGLEDPIFYIIGNPEGHFGQDAQGAWTTSSIIEYARRLAMPVGTLSIQLIASWSRYQRASMIESLQSDFIRTAKAKGASRPRVYFRHALRNAELPMVNVIALDIGALFGGLIVTEKIFNINGMGSLFLRSLSRGDATTLVSWTILTAAAIIICNLIADLILPFVDPRIRTQ